ERADGGRRWGVESICQVLCEQGIAIAPATYYAAKSRTPSTRAVRDEQLKPVIAEVHEQNYGVYGARKMQAALRREKQIVIGPDQTAAADARTRYQGRAPRQTQAHHRRRQDRAASGRPGQA